MTTLAITADDIQAAATRLAGVAHRTPVLSSRTADELAGARLFFKCENFQRMGAFKFRGAYNALAQFSPEQRRAGVITFSSGNHAQAIALSARLLGMPSVIVMPQDAPAPKLAATRGYQHGQAGSEVVLYDRYTEDREAIGARLAAERGMTLIPPYDHPHVMAGQGTAAAELIEETGPLDLLLVCVGGGAGLLSGCAIAANTSHASIKVIGVEPRPATRRAPCTNARAWAADARRRRRTGRRTAHLSARPRACTASSPWRARTRGSHAFPVGAHDSWSSPRARSRRPACSQAPSTQGSRVGIILSGGNVDLRAAAALA
jgi:threonine dehydratase